MPATTLIRDSVVGDDWIRQSCANVPVQRILDDKGQPTGDILTGPVRLAFANLFTLPPVTAQNNNPKFGAIALFTPLADLSIFYEEYYRVCAEKFSSHYDQGTQQYHGLHSPFRDQAEKLKFGGFTPGCTFITCTSKYKPPVVDFRRSPIVDQSKVYAGVWAILAVNAYGYADPRKKGVAFGLQSVMIIGDDTHHGGGAKDPNQTFAKVNVAAPIVPPSVAGMMPGGQGGIPPRPGAPAIPQTHYTPPSVPMPPVPPAPPAAEDDMSWLYN